MRNPLIAFVAMLGLCSPAAAANHDTVVPPVGRGPFTVACSNVAQDEAIIASLGSTPAEIWEGRPRDGQPRYISQVLSAPQTALRFDAPVPDLRSLYPHHAGEGVDHLAIVCHPTPASNSDPDYVLPGSIDVVPHMQRAGAAPKFMSISEYFTAIGYPDQGQVSPIGLPLIVFSHGLGGSPISSGYIDAVVDLASQGFVVGAVFHGDARFSRIRIEDLSDFWYLITQFENFVEMQLMRPVALKAMTDMLLSHPQYSAGIHPDWIGGFGASMGGQSMANLLGARLTTTLGLECRETVRDPRVRAAVGLVPYAGQTFLPSFCGEQSGADDVARPYLAISGTADTTGPINMAELAVHRFGNSRYLVQLEGGRHEYLPKHRDDVMTWAATFLRAYVGGYASAAEVALPGASDFAMARLIRMKSVEGGLADSLRVDVHVARDLPTGDPVAVEYYSEVLAHFFITADADEAAYLDASGGGSGWMRTGHAFRVSKRQHPEKFDPTSGVPVCRFFGHQAGGPDSHFFTADPGECASMKTTAGWNYEGIGFWALPANSAGECPAGMLKVLQASKAGAPRNDANQRFTTSDSTWLEMGRLGWALEGVAMCASP